MLPTEPRRLVILTEGQFGVHDAKTAWGVIRYGRDDVVAILDSTMAGRNVSEFMPSRDIPIVVITGYNRQDIASSEELKADFCLTKPAAFDDVIQVISNLTRADQAWRAEI